MVNIYLTIRYMYELSEKDPQIMTHERAWAFLLFNISSAGQDGTCLYSSRQEREADRHLCVKNVPFPFNHCMSLDRLCNLP